MTVRYQVVDRKGNIVIREKKFNSEAAAAKWVESQHDSISFLAVVSFSH